MGPTTKMHFFVTWLLVVIRGHFSSKTGRHGSFSFLCLCFLKKNTMLLACLSFWGSDCFFFQTIKNIPFFEGQAADMRQTENDFFFPPFSRVLATVKLTGVSLGGGGFMRKNIFCVNLHFVQCCSSFFEDSSILLFHVFFSFRR